MKNRNLDRCQTCQRLAYVSEEVITADCTIWTCDSCQELLPSQRSDWDGNVLRSQVVDAAIAHVFHSSDDATIGSDLGPITSRLEAIVEIIESKYKEEFAPEDEKFRLQTP